METFINPPENLWPEILKRPVFETSHLFEKVNAILEDIEKNGDQALKKYTLGFDNVEIVHFRVSKQELDDCENQVNDQLKSAIKDAHSHILKFHASQRQNFETIETVKGVKCWQKAVPVEKTGLYIPGGSAPLFSTVLMLAVPAVLAGCQQIVLCSPPDKNGNIHPAILYAAKIAGVTEIYKLGGVQAIGALAFGTETVPKVYKIFGPGNQYVTIAKQIVAMKNTAIDMPAGPSEVMVVADETAVPQFVASDLLSQAEHGADSQVILLSKTKEFIEQTKIEIQNQLKSLPRAHTASLALKNSRFVVMENDETTIRFINEYAPEHLIIATKNYSEIAGKITNAGSVFLGNYTPESAGDYASGTNHTLPTNGWAKTFSGVNLDSFLKKITFQEIMPEGLKNIGPTIEIMAEGEQLQAHKNAISIRLGKIK